MRIAITLGDPNGIGPEVAIKAAQHFALDPKIKPLLVGDGFVIEDTANGLKIVHATLHESVREALARLSPELVIAAAEAIVDMAKRLGQPAPSIGVFGINPHAGEDGLFGDDDERITKPAVAELKRRGIAIDGPVGADLLLSQRKHDVYLAMFHDQGHIPIKLIQPLRA